MEVSVSSQKQSVISPPECMSDPEEQEISEEEDDDRNHKHRRRETRSQSLERDSSDQVVFTRPYRKNNIHFENGNSFNQHQKRHPGAANVRFDSNQRIRSNHTFSRDTGPGRGGGRGYGSWAQRDSRFNPVDLSSHMVQVGSMTPGFFGGRGLSGVSTAQNSPWPAFGMLPGVPTGGLDTLHPIGLQGSLRPPLNSQLNLGIQQRCRDFEERGFCLRGDMCLMEHGVNRIVVDDVQSLSQFNLPVSLPGAPLLAAPSKAVPTHFGSSSAFMSAKGANGKNNESGMTVDGLGYGDPYPAAAGTDFYDPDQPLWNNSTGETSGAISGRNPNGIDETVATLDCDNQDVAENACGIRNSRSTRKSVWGQICGSNSQGNFKEKGNSALNSSIGLEDEVKEVSISSSRQGKRNLAGETVAKFDSSKAPNDATTNTRKHGQKAMRTLFVNGVPGESNKRDLLLAHFQKFGNVIDIRIPLNSERAFVQFSKREEAEAALKAPDAVMGNRFIKLWWANWDSIQDNGPNTGNGASLTRRGMISAGGQNKFPITPTSTSNHASTGPKGPGEAPSSCEQPKLVVSNGPKVPPLQKKSEALEQLKEELRKKQEMLEQKRNEFRKQLAKFEKQATVIKDDEAEEQSVKRLKTGTPADLSAASPPTKPKLESLTEKSKLAQNPMSNFKLNTETWLQEPKNSKPQTYPFAASMNTPMVNRYKLDNRTTTIKVAPPLPTGLADVDVLKEYFSSFGEVSKVEIEDEGPSGDNTKEGDDTSNENLTAHVTFAKRSAAEKAFANAKCWQGHVLRFVWVTTRQTGKEDNPSVSNSDKSSSVHSDPKAVESSPVSNIKESSVGTSDDKNVVSGDDASEKQEKEGIEIETSELMEASEATGMEEEQQPLGSNLDG
ncbi:PREDICTED: zinc finger CCCH domain-containing protein 41 [Tarenaya hassleriana]|uniref:zinc finger CCCH domain-containing protein 41 n=1 Tax=Tarenaya hassleriana TaxID=28532 RepID=UPI00053C37B8|nr:PREDICTED: zinc finger CCCH domain-containing protein 41 [Tarenaya hassleriana]XP_010528234.1 PREDICTED: zinc finger CCCH domain-containing protein 41 [Tarenaya hassleriana]